MRTSLALLLALPLLAAHAPAGAQDDKQWPPPSPDEDGDTTTPPTDEPTEPVPPPPPATTTAPPAVRTQPAPAPAPQPAPAFQQQQPVDPRVDKRFLLDGFFHVGFAGSFNVTSIDGATTDRTNDLGLYAGGGVRGTFVLGRYFGVGPMIRVASGTVSGGERFGDAYLLDDATQIPVDVAVSLMGRIPLGFMDVYATLPVGLTFTSFEFNDTSNLGVGYNVGLSAGARFWLGNVFNVFVELGFVYRSTVETVSGIDPDTELPETDEIVANAVQGALQAGISVGF